MNACDVRACQKQYDGAKSEQSFHYTFLQTLVPVIHKPDWISFLPVSRADRGLRLSPSNSIGETSDDREERIVVRIEETFVLKCERNPDVLAFHEAAEKRLGRNSDDSERLVLHGELFAEHIGRGAEPSL